MLIKEWMNKIKVLCGKSDEVMKLFHCIYEIIQIIFDK